MGGVTSSITVASVSATVTKIQEETGLSLNIKEVTNTEYELTGTDIDASNGGVQYKTLSAPVTLTSSISAGQIVIVHFNGGDAHTITWPTMTWVKGEPPIMKSSGVVLFWNVNGTLYGSHSDLVA